ncbi:MAG: bifunctional folylpolyglutamate synthase/dihydrofolate synthase, partial [Novibacillus thermophilus]
MKASEWQTVQDVEQWVYASYLRAKDRLTDTLDEKVRRPQLTRLLLDRLASPDRSDYNVVVAGSKGKGSTSVMLAEILRQHGWRVGLFTSPHLICFTERIRLNGDVISDGDFVRLARRVKEVADPIAERLAEHEYVSPVGLAAVMAALYFHEQGTDVNIWECGRGALFDDVNQVVHQEAVITPILSEHLTQLGPDWQEVVRHKLGVVTSTVRHVYIGKQDPQVEREIRRRTGGWKELEIVWAGRDVCVSGVHTGMRGTAFTVQTERGRYEKLMVPLIGEFQADNAALAVACAENVVQRLNSPRQRPAFRRLTH